ncbi:MAG: exodeoxyribonuclease large subunit, partial [Thermodesulfobacteriota bacterium]|nr:exodeoxyribonuclease large subunit [Thermodesulfobacteriota bacterium]
EPRGLGGLMLAYEQLKQKLQAEGLFDPTKKKSLPLFPQSIGLVTSPKGAAIRDMIRIISRRFPPAHILVSPASVQGDKAPEEIVKALERLERAGGVDVIIIGRGGGSVEDLWAFNDERVVRAVASCPMPIVSAVGHETDFTLTDFAADLRASTPSAAAELVVRDKSDLLDGVRHLNARMKNAMQNQLTNCAQTVTETLKRLPDPRRRVEDRRINLDDLTFRLTRSMEKILTARRQDAQSLTQRLRPEFLRTGLHRTHDECVQLLARLQRSMTLTLHQGKTAAENVAKRLDGLSPLAVLARGYSITFEEKTGAIVNNASQVQKGDRLRIKVQKGDIACRVTGSSLN